ncbi:MAG: hypothetical protein DSY50_02755 [Desulfobulbus sp.]|nr:MAG: hypothetical protein DSY50_02755 [Desulfobulbus sp.]
MKNRTNPIRSLVFILIALPLLLTGCADNSFFPKTSAPTADGALPPVSGFADDIQDIVIPADMRWDRDKSMTIKTESFRGGLWQYSGRLEIISVKDFMISSMQDNKWKLVGEAASKDIMLAFVKPNKTCMMVISDTLLGKSELTLYVTIDKTASTGLNPFGEAVPQ